MTYQTGWGEVVEGTKPGAPAPGGTSEQQGPARRGIVTSPAEIEKAHRRRAYRHVMWTPEDAPFLAEVDNIVRELRQGLAQDRLMAAHREEMFAERDRRSAEVQQALQAEFEASERERAISEGETIEDPEKPIEEPKEKGGRR
jgi:hypothetical protein